MPAYPERMEKMPKFSEEDECFLCNQPVRFSEEGWEVTVTFRDSAAGAERPSAFLWAHEDCARRAEHADFAFPSGANTW
jgi:hypothetical protein